MMPSAPVAWSGSVFCSTPSVLGRKFVLNSAGPVGQLQRAGNEGIAALFRVFRNAADGRRRGQGCVRELLT